MKRQTMVLSAGVGMKDVDIFIMPGQLPEDDAAIAGKCQAEAKELFRVFRETLPSGTVKALWQNWLVEEVMTDNGCRVMSTLREVQREAEAAQALHLHTSDDGTYIFDVLMNELPAKTRNELGRLLLSTLLQGALPAEIWEYVSRVADWWEEPAASEEPVDEIPF